MEIIKIIFGTTWIFFPLLITVMVVVHMSLSLIKDKIRHNTIRKVGYPPQHCNVDGTLVGEYEDKYSDNEKDRD